ncbi:MAG: hypothetical protein RR942_06440 [Romboutsia sp.]
MIEILMKNLNLKLRSQIENQNYYLENDDIYVSVVMPHAGNNFKLLIRADYKETFDRWSNCLYEVWVDNNGDLKAIIDDVNNLVKHKDSLLVKSYDKYDDEYFWDINENKYDEFIML